MSTRFRTLPPQAARPWIGIPARYHEQTGYFGQIRHYLDAVMWAGGLPLLIPAADPSIIREYLGIIDGVLLPGSPTDIDPAHYGAAPHAKLGRLYPERDSTDFLLLEHVEQSGLPLLGICFGAQSLNVYRGGSLVQDIPSVIPDGVVHNRNDDDPAGPARHIVRIAEDSLIGRLAGGGPPPEVNSYHHQSVEKPGRDLLSVAFAPDGVIEAVEDSKGRFIVGVQWHPERDWKTNPLSQGLFKAFMEKASLIRNGR